MVLWKQLTDNQAVIVYDLPKNAVPYRDEVKHLLPHSIWNWCTSDNPAARKKKPRHIKDAGASLNNRAGRMVAYQTCNAASQQCKCGILTFSLNTTCVYLWVIIALVVNTRSLMKREQGLGGTCSRTNAIIQCIWVFSATYTPPNGFRSWERALNELFHCCKDLMKPCESFNVITNV